MAFHNVGCHLTGIASDICSTVECLWQHVCVAVEEQKLITRHLLPLTAVDVSDESPHAAKELRRSHSSNLQAQVSKGRW